MAARGLDLILMDIQMPVMDGVPATRQIRALEASRLRRTPIIALTANALRHQTEQYAVAGMDGVVAKPLQVAELLSAIAMVIENAGPGVMGGARSGATELPRG